MVNWPWVSLGLAVMVSSAQGCTEVTDTGGHACTLIGWSEGLTVNIASDTPMTKGVYRLVVEIPDETFDVDLKITDPGNTQDGIYVSQHVDRGNWQLNASLTGTPRASGEVSIGRLGNGGGGPNSVTLTVQQDGVEIGRLELDAIDYRKDEPNGPGCGVATTATASISIAPVQ